MADGRRAQIGTFAIKWSKGRFKDAAGSGSLTAILIGTDPETLAITLDGAIWL